MILSVKHLSNSLKKVKKDRQVQRAPKKGQIVAMFDFVLTTFSD
jgi:hypothetical protein